MKYLASVAAALLMLPSSAVAAIAFVNSSVQIAGAANTTFTQAVTGCSTTNALIVVSAWSNHLAPTDASAVVINGVTASEAMYHAFSSNGTAYGNSIWFVTGATTSTQTAVVTYPSSRSAATYISCYSGAAQSGQPDATTTANYANGSAVNSFTHTVSTSVNNDWIVQVAQANTQSPVSGTNDTVRQSDSGQGTVYSDTNSAQTPAGSKSMTLNTTSNSSWDSMVIPFKPFVAAVSTSFGTLTFFGWF